MPEHRELRLLCDYLGGVQAVNTPARPAPAVVNGELENNERGEVVYAEIWSPVNALGVEEELRKVRIVADGIPNPYVSLSGIRATCMVPPKDRIWSGKLYSFGTPMSSNPLLNTTIKYKHDITVETWAGPTVAITQPFRVRLWGYVYKDTEIPGAFGGNMLFPSTITERTRNRTVFVSKPAIPINADTWLTLPGGKDQSIPKINPFVRYAYNLLASDGAQGDYQFRLTTFGVVEPDEDMYFDFDEKDALLIEGLGCKLVPTVAIPVPVNLARTGLRIAGNYHPKGQTDRVSLFPTTPGINELNYGFLFPFAPVTHPYFAAIPKLPQPYLIWNEIGFPVIRDDGVGPVGINTCVICLTGIRLEMRS